MSFRYRGKHLLAWWLVLALMVSPLGSLFGVSSRIVQAADPIYVDLTLIQSGADTGNADYTVSSFDKVITLNTPDAHYIISGTSSTYRVRVGSNVSAITITLKDARIDGECLSLGQNTTATVYLEGSNFISPAIKFSVAGIQVREGSTLYLETPSNVSGSLVVYGGKNGGDPNWGAAGIGADTTITSGNIFIGGSAHVTAYGAQRAAGIGSSGETAGRIVIKDSAQVEAFGGVGAAGIGSGLAASVTSIIISDQAQVMAQGGKGALYSSSEVSGGGAGIGGGGGRNDARPAGSSGTITISDTAVVRAYGGDGNVSENGNYYSGGGAGIGTGGGGTSGTSTSGSGTLGTISIHSLGVQASGGAAGGTGADAGAAIGYGGQAAGAGWTNSAELYADAKAVSFDGTGLSGNPKVSNLYTTESSITLPSATWLSYFEPGFSSITDPITWSATSLGTALTGNTHPLSAVSTTLYLADTTKPTIAAVLPSGSGAALNDSIAITFREEMDTAVPGVVQLTYDNGSKTAALPSGSWSANNSVYTVEYSGLSPDTFYNINISGFKDIAGNEMDSVGADVYTFTTIDQQPAPVVAFSYGDETLIGLRSGIHAFSTDAANYVYATVGSSAYALEESWFGQTLSLVYKGIPDVSLDSEATALTIPARPEAPTGLQGQNESVSGLNDGKISGTTSAMVYRFGNAGSWTSWQPCPAGSMSGLSKGTYQVAFAATDDSFRSEAAAITIADGSTPTYTLTLSAPSFENVRSGYARPAAKALTISSSGNSAATISRVISSSEAFEIAGSGASVPAGGSISSWTVQPKAALGIGTHTATIAAYYDNGAFATAALSFTVQSSSSYIAPNAPGGGSGSTTTTNSGQSTTPSLKVGGQDLRLTLQDGGRRLVIAMTSQQLRALTASDSDTILFDITLFTESLDGETLPTTIRLSKSDFRALAEAGKSIEIRSEQGSMLIDTEAMLSLASSLKNISGVHLDIVLKPLSGDELPSNLPAAQRQAIEALIAQGSPIYEISLMVGSRFISTFAGHITLQLPWDQSEPQLTAGRIPLWNLLHIAEDGILNAVASTEERVGNWLDFLLQGHFSYYAVELSSKAAPTSPATDEPKGETKPGQETVPHQETAPASAIVLTIDSSIVRQGEKTLSAPPVAPQIIHGRTMLPFRYLIQTLLGGEVNWNEATRSIEATVNGVSFEMTIDDTTIVIDGEAVVFDQAPVIVNDYTLVPLRVFEKAVQSIDWDEAARTVTIVS